MGHMFISVQCSLVWQVVIGPLWPIFQCCSRRKPVPIWRSGCSCHGPGRRLPWLLRSSKETPIRWSETVRRFIRLAGTVSNRADAIAALDSDWDGPSIFGSDATISRKEEAIRIGLDFCVEITYLNFIVFRRNARLRPRRSMPKFKCRREAHMPNSPTFAAFGFWHFSLL